MKDTSWQVLAFYILKYPESGFVRGPGPPGTGYRKRESYHLDRSKTDNLGQQRAGHKADRILISGVNGLYKKECKADIRVRFSSVMTTVGDMYVSHVF